MNRSGGGELLLKPVADALSMHETHDSSPFLLIQACFVNQERI